MHQLLKLHLNILWFNKFKPKVQPEVTKRQTDFFNQKLLELAETRKQQVKNTKEAKVIQKEINMARAIQAKIILVLEIDLV